MKTNLPQTLALAAAVLVCAGCLNTSRHSAPPDDWLAAVTPAPGRRFDCAGHYSNRGQNRGVRNDVGSPFLQDLFVERRAVPETAASVRLVPHSPEKLEATIHRNGQPEVAQALAVETDSSTGAITLPARSASLTRSQGLMAMAGTTVITLWQGTDGYLYAHFKTRRAGVVMAVVPMGQSEEGWVRWAPVQAP